MPLFSLHSFFSLWHNPQERTHTPPWHNHSKLMLIATESWTQIFWATRTPWLSQVSILYLCIHPCCSPNNHNDWIYIMSNNCFSFNLNVAWTTTKGLIIWEMGGKRREKHKVKKISFESMKISLHVDNRERPTYLFLKKSWKQQRCSPIGFPVLIICSWSPNDI